MRMLLILVLAGCALWANATVPKPPPPLTEGIEMFGPFEEVPEPMPGTHAPAGWNSVGERLLPIRFSAMGSHKSQWDFPIRCDLTRCDALSLDVCVASPQLKSFFIYLKSGPGGWYRGSVRMPTEGTGRWLRLNLTRSQFPAVEGNPRGWDHIDGLRIAFHRPRGVETFRTVVALANMGKVGERGAGAPSKEASAMAAAKAAKRKAEVTAFASAADAWAKSLPGKTGERRLMWCHSPLGLKKDGDWETSVRELKECGYTDLIANLAWGYGADYPSRIMPPTPLVAKHGDLFAAAKAACRKHGVRFHVWLVCWPMARGIDKSYAESLERQGRLQRNAKGALVRTNNTTWLCPSSPENRTLLGDAMLELAEKGADGVHFDYIRYPGEGACYCQNCRIRFEATMGRQCADWPKAVMAGGTDRTEWVKFRVENVTALVKAVGDAVHSRHPGVEVSAAVFRDPRGDMVSVGQDWAGWLKAGLVDFVCPMDYTWNLEDFRAYLQDQKEVVGTAKVYPGIGLTSSARFPLDGGDAYRFSEQVLAVREEGFSGFTCFNFDGRCIKAMRIAREGVLRP